MRNTKNSYQITALSGGKDLNHVWRLGEIWENNSMLAEEPGEVWGLMSSMESFLLSNRKGNVLIRKVLILL